MNFETRKAIYKLLAAVYWKYNKGNYTQNELINLAYETFNGERFNPHTLRKYIYEA